MTTDNRHAHTPPIPPPKRRRVRKGTTSCWGCKRRKVRCIFDADERECRECRLRDASCVGQDCPSPEDGAAQLSHTHPGTPANNQTAGRAHHLEQLMQQVITRVDIFMAATADERSVPSRVSSDPRISAVVKLSKIRQKLLKALPSPDDAFKIYEYDHFGIFFHKILFVPHNSLESHLGQTAVQATEALLFETHPAVLAKNMLVLATALQRAGRDAAFVASLSEPHHLIMTRLADAAITLVCPDDELMTTVEALQCLLLQSVYLANAGHLRLALLACRRALTMAQLMGLHRPSASWNVRSLAPADTTSPRIMWFRVLYLEHFLCLLLGVPSSHRGSDKALQPSSEDHPLEQLEKRQVAAAHRIMDRNEHDLGFRDLQTLQNIENDMNNAAALMPAEWWEVPTYTGSPTSPTTAVSLWETVRTADQLFHHFLHVQLYLPFLLRGSDEMKSADAIKLKCVKAGRDVLVRYVSVRAYSGACGIPDTADFFALVAAMAVLLGHIDTHRVHEPGANPFASLRLGDRDLVENALRCMSGGCSASEDVLSVHGADVLRKLLAIEADAASGVSYSTTPESDDEQVQTLGGASAFRLKIPYFGTVVISPDVVVGREPLKRTGSGASEKQVTVAGSDLVADEMGRGLPNHFQDFYPGYSARAEDWFMQGVDAAFFNILTGGSTDFEA